jgi:hypothetical protein
MKEAPLIESVGLDAVMLIRHIRFGEAGGLGLIETLAEGSLSGMREVGVWVGRWVGGWVGANGLPVGSPDFCCRLWGIDNLPCLGFRGQNLTDMNQWPGERSQGS